MNVLPRAKQEQVIAALLEGASVRSVERLTGVHRDTILRLMVRVGRHCFLLMDREIRGVRCELVQCDLGVREEKGQAPYSRRSSHE